MRLHNQITHKWQSSPDHKLPCVPPSHQAEHRFARHKQPALQQQQP